MVPFSTTKLTLENLFKEMKVMFDHKPRKLQLRKQFEERYWKHGENFSDYVHDKIIMGNRVPIDKEEIVDYLINGILDAVVKNQARMQNFETVDDLLKAFEKITLRSRGPNGNHGGGSVDKSTSKASTTTSNAVKGQKQQSGEQARSRRRATRCYTCDEVGHEAKNCTKPKKSFVCFRCNEEGHISKNCLQLKQVTHVGEMQVPEHEFHQSVEYGLTHNGERFNFRLGTLFATGSPISFVKEKFTLTGAMKMLTSTKTQSFVG